MSLFSTPPAPCQDGVLRRVGWSISSAVFLGTALASSPFAATLTWDGDGPSDTWSSVGTPPVPLGTTNWVGLFALPRDGDVLQFAGTTRLQNTNSHLSSVGTMSFVAGAGAFVLGGNALSVNYSIDNRSSNLQTINMPITADKLSGGHNDAIRVAFIGGAAGLRINGAFSTEDGVLAQLMGNVQIDNPGRTIVFGNAGEVRFLVYDNSSIGSRSVRLGARAAGYARLLLSGTDARLTTSEDLVVGVSGIGDFALLFNAVSTNATARLADQAGSRATATIESGAEWHIARGLFVGALGSATMSVKQGGSVFSGEGAIGADNGAGGSAEVSAGGRWIVDTRLAVGTATGAGTLDVLDGGLVSAKSISIGAKGVVHLNGGELAIEDFTSAGRLDWTAGTLAITKPGGAALGAGPLPSVLNLAPNMRLEANQTFTVGAGTVLVLNGGVVRSQGLSLNGGTIVAYAGGFDPSNTGGLTGYGVVAGAVTGGAGSLIRAFGTLTLGDAANPSGFDFDGELETGFHQVVLLSAGKAGLGSRTSLGSDSRLSVPNGAFLAGGRSLDYTGNATILGTFINAGSVDGSGGTLTFLNDVSGPGSFAGAIAFRAGYSPGNSPAIVDFGGGDASFASTSVLTMELFGPTPGTQRDQLLNIGHLRFDGRLHLVFGNGFSLAPGESLALFEFRSFSGSFSPDRIEVDGIDSAQLDFSRLAADGTIAAVPEPAEWMLLGAGTLLVLWRGFRRPAEMPPSAGARATV